MNLRNLILPLPLLFVGGCGEAHGHGDPHDSGGEHHHEAVHAGGVLAELGEHQSHLEAALDAEAGTLTLWVWDGHVEQAIRLSDDAIPVEVSIGDETFALACAAQESVLTGERVGDSSEFLGEDARLKGAQEVHVRVASLRVQGVTYADLGFRFPAELEQDEDGH